jgi:hypothetical protein
LFRDLRKRAFVVPNQGDTMQNQTLTNLQPSVINMGPLKDAHGDILVLQPKGKKGDSKEVSAEVAGSEIVDRIKKAGWVTVGPVAPVATAPVAPTPPKPPSKVRETPPPAPAKAASEPAPAKAAPEPTLATPTAPAEVPAKTEDDLPKSRK